MRKSLLFIALPALLLATAQAAHGGEPELAEGTDYRYQLILADVASWGALYGGAAANSEALAGVGVGSMLFAAPLIHAANGNPTGAWESLAVRVGLTGAGALVGYLSYSQPPAGSFYLFGPADDALAGAVIGMAVAQVIDWTVIGGKSRHERTPISGFSLTPTVAATPMGAQLGAVGTF